MSPVLGPRTRGDNQMATLPDLMPAMPEILLALGALVLLLIGVFAGERAAGAVLAGTEAAIRHGAAARAPRAG